MNSEIKTKTNEILMVYLPYFVFIMYCINRSSSIFKERLKALIKINLLLAIFIGGGLALILYLSGGTDNPLNYAILFLSIIAMSIFFSVHYLVMYYLLQPYNVSTEMKSSTYKVVQAITYFVCWYMIQVKLPTMSFGLIIAIFYGIL